VTESSLKPPGRDAASDPDGCLPAAAADHIGKHDRIRLADRDGPTIALATVGSPIEAPAEAVAGDRNVANAIAQREAARPGKMT